MVSRSPHTRTTESFSVSANAVLVGACALVLSLVTGCGGGQTPEHKQAVKNILDLGGRINFVNGGYAIDFKETVVSDADLAQLKDIAHLKDIDLRGTQITDVGLQHLSAIPNLQFVRLERTHVTDDGVAALKKAIPNLQVHL